MKHFFLQSIAFLCLVFVLCSLVGTPVVVSAQSKIISGLIPCGNAPAGASLEQIKAQECGFDDLLFLGRKIINYLALLSIPITAIAFAWAGFLYISSGGSEGKIGKAKEIFWKVMWGFIFVLTAWLIVYTITQFLAPGFSLLT